MSIAITIIFGALTLYFLYLFAPLFDRARGTLWQRALAAGAGSATKLVANIVLALSALMSALLSYLNAINATEIETMLAPFLEPEYVPLAFMAVMVIVKIARNRTLP